MKGEILTKVFYRKGKTWFNGDSYLYNTHFDKNKHQVYYDNMGMCTTNEDYIEEKQIPVYTFEKVDMSKYLTQDDAEIMAYEWGYDTNFEYETPLAQYDITIDEFFANKGLLFIHCDEEWKAKILARVFDDKGEKWGDGKSYLDTTKYNTYRKKSCYSNYGGIANISDFHTNIIYSFDKVDLSPYLSQMDWEEIVYHYNQKIEESRKLADENKDTKPRKKRGHKYKITVDEFWEDKYADREITTPNGKLIVRDKVIKVIHCDKRWKADILTSVFSKMGKKWSSGDSYFYSQYHQHKDQTCYDNMGDFCTKSWYEDMAKRTSVEIYPFNQVDLSKYLSPYQIETIRKSGRFDPIVNAQEMGE